VFLVLEIYGWAFIYLPIEDLLTSLQENPPPCKFHLRLIFSSRFIVQQISPHRLPIRLRENKVCRVLRLPTFFGGCVLRVLLFDFPLEEVDPKIIKSRKYQLISPVP